MSALNTQWSKGERVWNTILERAFQLPGARVIRSEFLFDSLASCVSDEKARAAVLRGPERAGVEPRTIERIAQDVIEAHRARVSGLSVLTSLPPGVLQVGAMPADMIQFFWHCVVLAQKLAYLYGWPELLPDRAAIHEETLHIFTLFLGVMFGSRLAGSALSQMSALFSAEMVKRLPQKALTKLVLYKLSTQVARWIARRLTKHHLTRLFTRTVPIIGGVISGTLTWVTFSRMSRRLHAHLQKEHHEKQLTTWAPTTE